MSIFSKPAPDGIGLLDSEGNLPPESKEKLLHKTIEKARSLPPKINLAGVTFDINELNAMVSDENSLKHFEPSGGIIAHQQQFPQYHALYMDTLYVGCVRALDLPPSNVLKPFGITDPTPPILVMIDVLIEILGPILDFVEDITALIVQKINVILAKINDFIVWLKNLLDGNFDLQFLIDLIKEILIDYAEEKVNETIAKIEEKAEEIQIKVIEKIKAFMEKLSGLNPFPINLPFIPFNLDFFNFNFDFSFDFGFPWFDLSMFQLSTPPGIITLIVEFIKGMIGIAQDAIAAIINSYFAFLEAMAAGLEAILEFMINLVLDPLIKLLKRIWPDIDKYTIPASHFIAMFQKVVPMLIVAIVGVLLGPGLITFSLAKNLDLI